MPLERDAEHMHQPGVKQHLSAANDCLNPALAPGMRVRLDGAPINTTLTSPIGTVVVEHPWDTYHMHLDSPAIYHNDDGTEQRLNEIAS